MSSAGPQGGSRKQLRVLGENEWACSNMKCLFINTTKVRFCERCSKAMPRGKGKVGNRIGKELSEKSKGLFAAEDWACSKCGNVNWARRTTCNICNAPKLGDVEARTGYGGGYMDRQNVEYRSRPQEEDDEFDEFGRRRKRRREEEEEAAAGPSVPKAPKEPRNDDEEEEEEDDEDDLGKYDFADLVEGGGGASPAHSYDSQGSCCSHSSCTCSGSTCWSSDPEGDDRGDKAKGGQAKEEAGEKDMGDGREKKAGEARGEAKETEDPEEQTGEKEAPMKDAVQKTPADKEPKTETKEEITA